VSRLGFGLRTLTVTAAGFAFGCSGDDDNKARYGENAGAGDSAASAGAATGGGATMSAGAGGATSSGGTSTAGGTSGTGGSLGNGGTTSTGGTAGAGGAAQGTGGAAPTYPTTCDAIGNEPTIPPPCATVTATKSAPGGTPSTESPLDTVAIQAAITACPSGQSVKLVTSGSNDAFVSGPLTMKSGVTLWIDTGVTLFASRYATDFDTRPGQCAGNNTGSGACRPLINVSGVGVGVMGGGTIDGRGGEPVGDTSTSWWDLENTYDGKLAAPRLIQATGGSNLTIYGITLKNSGKFHVVLDGTNGFTVWGVTVNTPADSPNTDGIDPSGAKNGLFAYNKISTGDDNIAIKGSGGLTDNILVVHNHFGRGHGMSIGSETFGGVQNVKVCDLSLDGTDNGLRIKSDSSRGGLVQNISYTDVCIRNVRHPLVFDPYYSSSTGSQIPDFKGVSLKNVHVLGAGSSTLQGYDASHALTLALDNVIFDDAGATFDAAHATITLGPGPVNFSPSGTNVTVTDNVTGSDAPLDCSNAWVTF
jgi:polygalacturonase